MLGREAKHSRSLMDGLASVVEAAYAAAALSATREFDMPAPSQDHTDCETLYVFEMAGSEVKLVLGDWDCWETLVLVHVLTLHSL